MARSVRSTQLETRSARLRLASRRKPYRIASGKQGLHLGYRRLLGKNGSWIAFTYQGKPGSYKERAFGQADDYCDADGNTVLSYYEAMRRLSGEAPPAARGKAYSVTDAVLDYLHYLKRHRKSEADAKYRLYAYVIPYFGDRQLGALKAPDFEKWLEWAIPHKPHGRLKDGKQSAAAERVRAKARGKELPTLSIEVSPAEKSRRRKSNLNRVINYLKAALNRAADQGYVESRDAWARFQKFRGADIARIARLSTEEARRLLTVSPPDFRMLVQVALLTGCRYAELAGFRVRDFDEGTATLFVAESKSGKPRRVPLTDEGQALLRTLTAGKSSDDLILTKADGMPWAKSEQFRRIRAACEAARIVPAVNFHAIRHTFASLLVEAGTPLAFVAEALGHSDIRMVSKHYAHLSPSIVHAEIRRNLPTFGVSTLSNARGSQS